MNPPAWAYRLLAISNQATIKRLKKLRKRVKSFNRAREQRQESRQRLADLEEQLGEQWGTQEAVERLVGPFLTGVYAGDEQELGAEAVRLRRGWS